VALEFPIELEFRNGDFLWREENRRTRRKTLGSRTRTNNKLQPTYDTGSRIRTRDTLVVGEPPKKKMIHTDIPASREIEMKFRENLSSLKQCY